MAEYVDFTLTFTDNSSGDRAEDGTEVQIYTDSPSYKPTVKINYADARHAWMALPFVKAGVTTLPIRLKAPVTFVTVRVRQFNENGAGDWNFPGGASGVRFDFGAGTTVNRPDAPTNVGLIVTGTPTPPVEPPVDPPPPPPPTGEGGTSSNYEFTAQFSGTQGLNQWSYRDASGNLLAYSSSTGLWSGVQAYQTIWNGGIHPGTSVGTVLRWTAPDDGTAIISGTAALLSASAPYGVTVEIKHQGVSIAGPESLTTTVPYVINETVVMLSGEVIDFIVTGINGNTYCSTSLLPNIQMTTDGVTPADPTLSTLSPSTISLNTAGTGTLSIAITSAAPSTYTVNVASSDTGKVTVPATVTIPAGQSSALITLTAVAVGSSTITASRSGSSNKTSVATVTAPVSGSWANAIAGGTVLLDHRFDSMTGLFTPYNNTFIVSDASAPMSPPNVARTRLEAFATSGGDEVSYTASIGYREMYYGLYWRTNPQFQGRISGNKLFFMRGIPGTNGVIYMVGGPNMGQANFSIVWSHNGGHLNNGHIMGGDEFGGSAFANVSSSVVVPGLWYKIEQHIRCSTTSTSRDGFIRMWINGSLTHSYDQLNYAAATATTSNPGFMNQWVWNQTWDTSGDMGVSNTVPWEHYCDHVYLVGKN